MSRKAFYSFYYKPDNSRASQVRNMGVIEGNRPASDNDWEDVKKGGDKAIQNWIDTQIKGKSVAIILIGENTAGRKWINYEIEKSWNDGKGVFGIYVHNLKDLAGNQSSKGTNPFEAYILNDVSMAKIVKSYNPPFSSSKSVYNHIKENLSNWIEEAIEIRGKY